MDRFILRHAHHDWPATSHTVMMIGGRVVKVQTQHVGESCWIAIGVVSEPVPTGPRLARPESVSARGATEADALQALRRQVLELNKAEE
jgi:hypothetical protein